MTDPKDSPPLWLPEGSIRSIMALLIVGALVYAVVFIVAVPDWFIAIALIIVRDYFESRKAANGQEARPAPPRSGG